MRKSILFAFSIFWLAGGDQVAGQIQVKVTETKTIASSDDPNFSGQLLNPNPCPADTNWVSFTRVVGERRELHFYNRKERKFKSISSSPHTAEESVDFFAVGAPKGYDDELDWCPIKTGGKVWFAFIGAGAGNNTDVYIANLTDLKPLRLTDNDGARFNDFQPKWSPNGSDLAFCSNRTGHGDIYLIRNVLSQIETLPAQPNLTRLTFSDEADLYPIWNPDSTSGYLAYTAFQKGPRTGNMTHTINLVDLYSDNRIETVTDDETYNFFRASWDPVSASQIACYATQEAVKDLKSDDPSIYESNIALFKLELKNGQLVKNPILGSKPFLAGKVLANGTGGPTWLPGSKGLLTVKLMQDKYNPLSSLNISNWQRGSGNIEEMLNMTGKFPREPRLSGDRLYASVLEGDQYKITESRLAGKLIYMPYNLYALSRPGEARIYLAEDKGKVKRDKGHREPGQGNFLTWLTGPAWGGKASILNNKLTASLLASGVTYGIIKLLEPGPEGGPPPPPPPPIPEPPGPPY